MPSKTVQQGRKLSEEILQSFCELWVSNNNHLKLRISRPNEPPRCGADGGLHFYSIPLSTRRASARSSHARVQRRSSLFATAKFIPLSDQIIDVIPRLTMNLSFPIAQKLESVNGTMITGQTLNKMTNVSRNSSEALYRRVRHSLRRSY